MATPNTNTAAGGFSYAQAGININETDKAKRDMAESMKTSNPRVMNRIGAFGALYDGYFPEMKHPILVMKTEEPGSKQKLAAESGKLRSICFDMINHLVNDIIVMGATPLAVQDAIIMGKTDAAVIKELVDGVAAACRANYCDLTGGETSIQPGVLEPGTFILTSSIVGIVDKDKVLDGATIKAGDTVLAVASNGLHTNGYTLVRALMAKFPELATTVMPTDEYNKKGGHAPNTFKPGTPESFFEVIMRPHTAYYPAVRDLFSHHGLRSMAHITGGGIQDNLNRILPEGTCALIDQAAIVALPLFREIKRRGQVDDAEMLRTFNCGVGLCIVTAPEAAAQVQHHLKIHGHDCYPIGTIVQASDEHPSQTIVYHNTLNWD